MILPQFVSPSVRAILFISLMALVVVLSIVYMNNVYRFYLDDSGDMVCIFIIVFSLIAMIYGVQQYYKEIEHLL